MNYFNLYPGDYWRDTTRLSLTEHGAFFCLLCAYYAEGQPLPSDYSELYPICRVKTQADRAAVRMVADKYFPICSDGYRHNARADREIEKAHPKIIAARENGKKGGRPPKPSGFPPQNPVGFHTETHAGVGVGAESKARIQEKNLSYVAAVAGVRDV